MKKSIVVLFIIVILSLGTSAFALESGDIHSNEALLIDLSGDVVLFHKDTKSEPVPMASLTKLMTYALVVENIKDLDNTTITPSGDAIERVRKLGASMAGIEAGYEYTVKDLLYGLLLPSGCDVAETFAVYFGSGDSGDTSTFVKMMNDKAKELGMNDTTYIDAHGIGTPDDDNFSSEQDIYILFKYLLNQPLFREIISTPEYTMKGVKDGEVKEYTLKTTNYLISPTLKEGKYYYAKAIGGKTGSLNVAGRCLVCLAKNGDKEVVTVTLGVPGESASTYDYHLTDTIKLLKYAFNEPIYDEVFSGDIISSNWAKEELEKAKEAELIPGLLTGRDFAEPINRAEFAAVIVKMYEKSSGKKIIVSGDSPFIDTEDEYVLKAYESGIVMGTTEDTFSPEKEITREQMATMLLRTFENLDVDVDINLDMIKAFNDDDLMHEWSRPAIYYFSVRNIIKGVGDNTYNVKGNAKIEEAVCIALRCFNKI